MAIFSLKSKEVLSNLTAPAIIDLGAMIPLMTNTLSGNATSVTFSNIPQNYEHLQIRAMARTDRAADTQDVINITFAGDTGANYSAHYLTANGSTVAAGAYTSASRIQNAIMGTASSSPASTFGVSIIDILDYSNSNKYKTVKILTGADNNTLSGYVQFNSGLWMNTSSGGVSSITFTPNIGTNIVQYSHFALYGIKRAGA